MLKHRRTSEEGFSLVELLVVIGILGIVGGIILNATVAGLQASRKAQERVVALNDLTRGLERIGRELRAASPLDLSNVASVAESRSQLGAVVQRDNKEYHYWYYLTTLADGTPALREDIAAFELDGTPIPAETRNGLFIVDTANVSEGIPLITYYDEAGAELDCASEPAVTGAADPAAACRAYLATANQVRLQLVKSLPEQTPVSVETWIAVRYARFN